MVEECRKSPVTERFPVEHIPYGLDTGVFIPRDPSLLRAIFEIPADSCVIGFVADNIDDPRKGMKSLLEALHLLRKECPRIHLVTVGNGVIPCGEITHTHLGPIQNDRLLSFFYSTCDLFVCPSLQDNLPNTVLESMACGAPVAAFAIGGMPDMVAHRESGWLVEHPGDPEALAAVLRSACDDPSLAVGMREVTIRRTVNSYALPLQKQRYLSVYQHIIGA
jgi:glycosyltransferase involved in cell wall biosynthesis